MTTTTTTKRITKAQRFTDIKALLSGEAVSNGTTVEDALAFIDKELELLARKNTSDKAPTKTQKENEKHKERILEFLTGYVDGATCTEIQKGVPEFADFQNQKVAGLLRSLKDEKKVRRETVKGKSLFFLA